MGGGSSKDDPRVKYAISTGGIYKAPSQWPPKLVKKLIYDRKLAPFFPPVDEDNLPPSAVGMTVEECPLCFLSFVGGMNSTLCCKKRICSECVVQVVNPPGVQPGKDCPFCLRSSVAIKFTGVLSKEELAAEEEEQEKVEKLKTQRHLSETMRALNAKTAPPAAEDIFPGKGKTEDQEQPEEEEDEAELLRRAMELSLAAPPEEMEVREERAPVEERELVVESEPLPQELLFETEEEFSDMDEDMRIAIARSLTNDW
jgi:hypothetical protein